MSNKIIFLGLLVILAVGCGKFGGTKGSPTPELARMAMAASLLKKEMLPTPSRTGTATATLIAKTTQTLITTQTPTPTFNPQPTETPTPIVSPSSVGPFVLSHWIGRPTNQRMPQVNVPSWLDTDEQEMASLLHVKELYDVFANGDFDSAYQEDAPRILAAANEFLERYPNGDGAIPVLMIKGHINTYSIAWWLDGDSNLLGEQYERLIELLMRRHPERVSTILDDLLELGLPISQVKYAEMDQDTQALFFAYQFSPPSGEPKGEIYTLVREKSRPWRFLPLPTHYDKGGQAGALVTTISDLNNDGQLEILVELEHAYAGGYGLVLNLFAWENEQWVERMDWKSIRQDAYYGEFWLEDLDKNGIQEILVSYFIDSPMSGNPRTVEVYQWSTENNTYLNTLPIQTQPCGYYTWAEAERLYTKEDFQTALHWYQETRRRWLEEKADTDKRCVREVGPDDFYIHWTFLRQKAAETEQIGANPFLGSQLWDTYPALEQVDFASTDSITSTVITTIRYANIYTCDVPDCRIIARYFLDISYWEKFPAQKILHCQTHESKSDFGYNVKYDAEFVIQLSRWNCAMTDQTTGQRLEWTDLQIVNVCAWDGKQYVQKEYRVIAPFLKSGTNYDAHRQLEAMPEKLAAMVDCSGDIAQKQ